MVLKRRSPSLILYQKRKYEEALKIFFCLLFELLNLKVLLRDLVIDDINACQLNSASVFVGIKLANSFDDFLESHKGNLNHKAGLFSSNINV